MRAWPCRIFAVPFPDMLEAETGHRLPELSISVLTCFLLLSPASPTVGHQAAGASLRRPCRPGADVGQVPH